LALDIDITLDPAIDLGEASHIAESVRLAALTHIDAARSVTVRPHAQRERH
jgi:hypothetical protein